ncbi:hypothetical protein ACFQS6_07900 [Xanthomonas populi]|uniref:hypothetical protein n=1 Tax=Xanthomonas populi TaxID=53414 RepID=UPI001ABF40CA|nr:hypothetical protein [Xanthomonas populi]
MSDDITALQRMIDSPTDHFQIALRKPVEAEFFNARQLFNASPAHFRATRCQRRSPCDAWRHVRKPPVRTDLPLVRRPIAPQGKLLCSINCDEFLLMNRSSVMLTATLRSACPFLLLMLANISPVMANTEEDGRYWLKEPLKTPSICHH